MIHHLPQLFQSLTKKVMQMDSGNLYERMRCFSEAQGIQTGKQFITLHKLMILIDLVVSSLRTALENVVPLKNINLKNKMLAP